jgi:hypothetical protein
LYGCPAAGYDFVGLLPAGMVALGLGYGKDVFRRHLRTLRRIKRVEWHLSLVRLKTKPIRPLW